MKARILDGELLEINTIGERKKLVGKKIIYLRDSDIDKSGRGYYFPRVGVVDYVKGKDIFLDGGDIVYSGDIVEMIEAP